MKKEEYKWKVCVRCYTYNHAPYITDAMNGFTMQQTDFPFVCCIVDDASTDGEQDIIKNYVEANFDAEDASYKNIKTDYGTLIFARHKTNHNCFFSIILLDKNHNSTAELKAEKRSFISEWENNCKYEALCEGDDYWIDPLKLQKQIDYLESHLSTAMCYSNIHRWYFDDNEVIKNSLDTENYKRPSSFEQLLLNESYIAPPTWVIRSDCYPSLQGYYVDGTFAMALELFANYEIGYLPESTAVYRLHSSSVTHSRNPNSIFHRRLGTCMIQEQFISKYKNQISNEAIAFIRKKKFKKLWLLACALNQLNSLKKLNYLKENSFKYLVLNLILNNKLGRVFLLYCFKYRNGI